jgi:hypothetical protein
MPSPYGTAPLPGSSGVPRVGSAIRDPVGPRSPTPPDNTGGWIQTLGGWAKNGIEWAINNAGTWVPLVAAAGSAYEGAQAQAKSNEYTQMAIDMAKGDYESRGKFRDAAMGKLLTPNRPDLSAFRDKGNPYASSIPKVGAGVVTAPSPTPTIPTTLPAATDPYSWRKPYTMPTPGGVAAPGDPTFPARQGAAVDAGAARRKEELDRLLRVAGIQKVGGAH